MESGIFIVYIVKVAIYMSLFYAFNKLLLSRETFHHFNRIFWIVSIGASFVLPLVVGGSSGIIHDVISTNISSTNISLDAATKEEIGSTSLVVNALFVIYIAGCIALLLHNILIHIHLLRFIFANNKSANQEFEELFGECEQSLNINREIRYIIHDRDTAPFSWFNYVVINRDDLRDSGKEIVIHELSHISQYHSVDVLLSNIVILLQWFNPTSWLIKREIQQLHEYCADDRVISMGISIRNYQLLLIKKAVGSRLYSISNSLNHSNLKNRITMMTREKSKRWSTAKSLYILPLAFSAVSIFANPDLNDHLNPIYEVEITNKNGNDQISVVGFSESSHKPLHIVDGVERSTIDDIDPNTIQNISVLKGEQATSLYGDKGQHGVIIVTRKSDNSSSTNPDKIEEVRVIGAGTVKKGESNSNQTLKTRTGDDAPLFIIDGKEVSTIKEISYNDILSISVLKDKSATEMYGNKGRNGVIIVELK